MGPPPGRSNADALKPCRTHAIISPEQFIKESRQKYESYYLRCRPLVSGPGVYEAEGYCHGRRLLSWVWIRVRRGALALKQKNYLSNSSRQKARLRMISKNQYEQSQGSFATRTHKLRFSKGDCSLKWRPPPLRCLQEDLCCRYGDAQTLLHGLSRDFHTNRLCVLRNSREECVSREKGVRRKQFNSSQEQQVVYQTASESDIFPMRGQESREKLCNFPRHKRKQKILDSTQEVKLLDFTDASLKNYVF